MALVRKFLSFLMLFALLSPTAAIAQAHKKSSAKKIPAKKTATKKTAAKRKSTVRRRTRKKPRKRISRQRAIRVNRAFKKSADLRPMAQQLLQNRTPQAYAAIEAYARKHAGTDEASLAYLTLGYAHLLDKEFDKAQPMLAKAKVHAGELSDYVAFFQAQAFAGSNDQDKVLTVLDDFSKNHADSLFVRDAQVLEANALVAQDRAPEAVKLLEANRLPTRADVELALGRAYFKTGNTAKATDILRRVYFDYPTSFQAQQAATALTEASVPIEGSFIDGRTRADLLAKAGRWSDAAAQYRDLTNTAPENERANMQVMLGVALRRSGDARDGKQLLQSTTATGEYEARRLYYLGEFARSDDDESALKTNLDRMREVATQSPWLQQALISAGNWYLLRKDFDHAIDMYREAAMRFPQGGNLSAYAHWKAAWLTYRQGRAPDARKAFEEQIEMFPHAVETSSALYWRAKMAEEDGDTAKARAWYAKCAQRYRSYYYGVLAKQRLAKLPRTTAEAGPEPLLDKIPPVLSPDPEAKQVTPPTDDLRLEKAKLLTNAGLVDFAVKELQSEDGGDGPNWATLEIARLYSESGLYHRALQFLKRSVPNYYALQLTELPRPYWEYLFPTPFWSDLRKQSEVNGLDPYLVASLIRQESEFNPDAVSHAHAYGLMQLLPTVGRGMARELKMRYVPSNLLDAPVNIRLGTRYFKEMVDAYNGQVEYALAAYNAGTNRVADWQQNGTYKGIDEFVESIPFTETREYVQAIMRNAAVYKQLYGK